MTSNYLKFSLVMLNIGSKLALEIFLINLEKKETALANPSMLPLPVDFKALIPGR